MQVQHDRHPWNVRALLESTATPFTIADYGPRAAIFRQGDPCVVAVARVFAGVALEGATLREDLDDNATLYGKKLDPARL